MNIPLSGCLLSVQRLGLYWPEPECRRPTRREGQSAMTSGKGLGKQNFESLRVRVAEIYLKPPHPNIHACAALSQFLAK